MSDGPKVLQTFRRSKPTLAASSEAVKDFQEIPYLPDWPLLGNLIAFMKNGSRLDKYFAELHAQAPHSRQEQQQDVCALQTRRYQVTLH